MIEKTITNKKIEKKTITIKNNRAIETYTNTATTATSKTAVTQSTIKKQLLYTPHNSKYYCKLIQYQTYMNNCN